MLQDGSLTCLELEFDEVFVDNEIKNCNLTREYPAESRLNCKTCALGTIPQYSESSWYCLQCDLYYEENGIIICADNLCPNDNSVFDLDLKQCRQCQAGQIGMVYQGGR